MRSILTFFLIIFIFYSVEAQTIFESSKMEIMTNEKLTRVEWMGGIGIVLIAILIIVGLPYLSYKTLNWLSEIYFVGNDLKAVLILMKISLVLYYIFMIHCLFNGVYMDIGLISFLIHLIPPFLLIDFFIYDPLFQYLKRI